MESSRQNTALNQLLLGRIAALETSTVASLPTGIELLPALLQPSQLAVLDGDWQERADLAFKFRACTSAI